MQVYWLSYPSFLKEKISEPAVIAIGYFDGVHIGHQKVIQTAGEMAERLGVPLALMTFDPHPKEVLGQRTTMRYLTPIDEKIDLLKKLGVEKIYVMKFDHNLAQLSAEEFVEKVCVPLKVKGVVTGFNFRFGKGQSGDADHLRILSQSRFETEKVPAVVKADRHVSSTWIRQLLSDGEIQMVTELLGRYYRIRGTVEHGDHRGRVIGFPTANLSIASPFWIPRRGVYIVRAYFEGNSAYGLMNIGIRPTFEQSQPQEKIEVHLFHSDIDLYGKELSVEILHFLRAERKFANVDALIHQIQQDRLQAERWLSTEQLLT